MKTPLFALALLVITTYSLAKPAMPPKKQLIKQSTELPTAIPATLPSIDKCPIINRVEVNSDHKKLKKISISFDVDVNSEVDFISCEKKIIKENPCALYPIAKKIEVRLRSVSEGFQGTEGQMIGDCIKSRKPASIQNGKKVFLKKFTLRTPLRLERKIKPSEIDYDEGY